MPTPPGDPDAPTPNSPTPHPPLPATPLPPVRRCVEKDRFGWEVIRWRNRTGQLVKAGTTPEEADAIANKAQRGICRPRGPAPWKHFKVDEVLLPDERAEYE